MVKKITEFFPIQDKIRKEAFFEMLELKAAETYRENPHIHAMINFLIFSVNAENQTVLQQQYVILNPEVVYDDAQYETALKKAHDLIEEIDDLKETTDPDLKKATFLGQFLMSIGAQTLRTPTSLTLLTPSTISLLAKTFQDEPSPIITVMLRDPGEGKEWEFLGCSPNTHIKKDSDTIQ